jgi:hypothetical protein
MEEDSQFVRSDERGCERLRAQAAAATDLVRAIRTAASGGTEVLD